MKRDNPRPLTLKFCNPVEIEGRVMIVGQKQKGEEGSTVNTETRSPVSDTLQFVVTRADVLFHRKSRPQYLTTN